MEENTATLEDVIIRSRRTFSIQSMHQFSPDCRRQHQKVHLFRSREGGVAGSYRGKGPQMNAVRYKLAARLGHGVGYSSKQKQERTRKDTER